MLLNEYKLSIPKIWTKKWQEAIDSSEGLLREAIIAQAHGAFILREIDEPRVTTERLGWLNLWIKVFTALEAVAAAISHDSKLVLLLTQRTTFELMLQIHAILDPISKPQKSSAKRSTPKHAEEYAMRSSIDRLRAYTAWCLWHDKAYFEELLNPKSLKDIWNADFIKILKSEAMEASVYNQFLKEMDSILDETKLQEGRQNMRKHFIDKVRQIEQWIVDPHLRKWISEIERASKGNTSGVPFFFLFDRSDSSIPKRLLKEGLRFSYSSYIMSSMVSHGSSMDEFFQIQDDTITPTLTGGTEQINTLAPEIIFRCKHLLDLLQTMNQHMLSKKHLRQ